MEGGLGAMNDRAGTRGRVRPFGDCIFIGYPRWVGKVNATLRSSRGAYAVSGKGMPALVASFTLVIDILLRWWQPRGELVAFVSRH